MNIKNYQNHQNHVLKNKHNAKNYHKKAASFYSKASQNINPEMRIKNQGLTHKKAGIRGGRMVKSNTTILTTTGNAMRGAMERQPRSHSSGRRSIEEGHVMGGAHMSAGSEPRRKPRSLPPLTQKPRSPVISTSPLDHELGSSRFIGSPPPTALRAHESVRDDNGNAVGGSRRNSESGEEERTVYRPANPFLELSQPRITLHTAPRNASPPPAHAIVAAENASLVASASSLSLRSLASMATESLALSQGLTPPPKLVSYRAEGGAEAVQEWVPDESGIGLATPPRKNSSPSIRDLPSPIMGRNALSRPPPPLSSSRRTRSTVKLSPIHKDT